MSMTLRFITFVFLFLSSFITLTGLDYQWKIEGMTQSPILQKMIENVPFDDKGHAVSSINVLRQLADNQGDEWLKELHSRAYYNAQVNWELQTDEAPITVYFNIVPGPQYPLQTVDISWDEDPPIEIKAEDLGLHLGAPAFPKDILQAEEKFLHIMALQGYPLAKILEREVFADLKTHAIRLVLHVDSGVAVNFGQTKITGTARVSEDFIWQKIDWKEGKSFDPLKIERTQESLEATGLFSSVVIREGSEVDDEGQVPLEIILHEAKHRTVAGGIGYSTQQGPGLTVEWQHRNYRGMGERLDVQAKIWSAIQTAQTEYLIPGFRHSNQDLRFVAGVEHEITKGYTETSFTLSSFLDKRINDWTSLSYGASYKQLLTTNSNNDGTFYLLSLPTQLKWTTANDFLDPTHGMTLNAKTIPAYQMGKHSFVYWTNIATGTFYLPLDKEEKWILAYKLTAGTIIGAKTKEIAPSERFYSGTENTLRGYRFMTVSPLDKAKKDPIGGRSMLVLSIENRWSCTEKIGLAAFYEVGNVYAGSMPEFTPKQLQSAGVGVRYTTPLGPIRFDMAFPLNRRKDLDPPFQFYMSIGQAF